MRLWQHPPSMSWTLRIFRAVARAEGISFLVLLGIAMPLKYVWDYEGATLVAGWTHGLLFIAYVGCMVPLFVRERWPMSRAPLVFAAALLPFGTFALEKKWLR